jgi:hypothetical protein
MVRGVHRRGLEKAHQQLLLASELTFDTERAETLAGLAHGLGELVADDADPDPDEIDRIDSELTDAREDAHPDVRDAIVRAQEVLSSYRGTPMAA